MIDRPPQWQDDALIGCLDVSQDDINARFFTMERNMAYIYGKGAVGKHYFTEHDREQWANDHSQRS